MRNAALALAGRDDAEAIAALEHALNDPEALGREAGLWAMKYHSGSTGRLTYGFAAAGVRTCSGVCRNPLCPARVKGKVKFPIMAFENSPLWRYHF